MMIFLTRLVLGAFAFIGHAAATDNVSAEDLNSFLFVMNPKGVACQDELHITSARLCVVAAKRIKITKMKINNISSKFQPPYGCSLKGKTAFFSGDKNAKSSQKSTPICRILPDCCTCAPDPSMNPSKRLSAEPSVEPTMGLSTQPSMNPSMKSSVHPSEKLSFNPSVKDSMNPSNRLSVEPSVYPTIGLTTQPSVNLSMTPSVHPSKQLSFNPSVESSVNPSMTPSVHPSKQLSFNPSVEHSMSPSKEPSLMPTSDPLSTFIFNGSTKIERAEDEYDYDGIIALPTTDYILRLTIEPHGTLNGLGSIIHITNGGNCCDYGTRSPALFFKSKTTFLQYVTGHNSKGDFASVASKELAIDIKSEIELRVVGRKNTLVINGVEERSRTVKERALLSNVTVYLGDPWFPAADATISNVYFGPA